MILKCVARDQFEAVRYRHFEVHGELSSGNYTFYVQPGERDYSTVLPEDLQRSDGRVFTFDIAEDPSEGFLVGPDDPGAWNVGFAYWYDLDRQEMQIVVTSGSMFLMSDQGDTIDKLR